MKKTVSFWITMVLFVAIGFGAGYFLSGIASKTEVDEPTKETPAKQEGSTEHTQPKVGDVAPDFELGLFNDEKTKITLSDYKGKKVLINFFVSWCQYCQGEAPDVEKLHKEFLENENSDTVILTVNLTLGEGDKYKDAVSEYIEKFGVTTPMLMDLEGETAYKYMVESTPTNVFIYEDGSIAELVEGALTYDQMKEILASMN